MTFSTQAVDGAGVAISASGNLMAVAGRGIFISTNQGAAWRTADVSTTVNWNCVAASADGRFIVADADAIGPFYSTNAGLTWAEASSSFAADMIVGTADGTRVVAGNTQFLYVSCDAGQTWSVRPPPDPAHFNVRTAMALSRDGSLLLVGWHGQYFASADLAVSWRQIGYVQNPQLAYLYLAVACSGDGTSLFAATPKFATATLPPNLKITPAPNQLVLSWPWPSSRYALQQSPDLSSMSWGDVTNNIIVTNYRNQVVLSRSAAQAFYRLQGPNP
ncbi:MAG TPA: hypothetical protein VHB20_17555 [Verrucomicrobiae bacterium]|nr:hypothetical protein [Verrucomicrobiae bacterium]